MSTSISLPPPEKKISSRVRPGVCETRASALRPASALIRLDLPTLERPANAISMPRIGGSDADELAAETNCQSPANSFRPASISVRVNPALSVDPNKPSIVDVGPVITFATESLRLHRLGQ